MRWICPRCRRPLPLAFDTCPHCQPEAGRSLLATLPPAAGAAPPRFEMLGEQPRESAAQRLFWAALGLAAVLAAVALILLLLWWVITGAK